jgi:hypothetical protein
MTLSESMNSAPLTYANALGELFGRWRFHHFAVLTYCEEVSSDTAMQATRKWIRRIEKLGGGKVWWLTTAEIGDEGRVHSHALLLNTASLPESRIADAWHLGRALVQPCVNSNSSARYLTKYAGTDRFLDYQCDLPRL